jgi:DNA-binding FadR family transcriptional regulator
VSIPKLATISERSETGWRPPDPRDTAQLDGVFRIRRLVEPELAAKACLLHTDAELDELEASLAQFPVADATEFARAARAWHTQMLAPAATAWDLRVLTPLWEATDRYLPPPAGWAGLASAADRMSADRELLASFRARDPERARAASRGQLDDEARRVRVCS